MSDYNDLELQEQLMNQLEEMQTEIDQYKLTIADLQNEVSKKDSQLSEVLEQAETLSSQLEKQSENFSEVSKLKEAISKLRSDNQQKSEMIKSLNEKIGTLSESDIVLKNNEELKKLNEKLKQEKYNAEQEAMTEVRAVRDEYARKERRLARTQEEASELRTEAESLKKRQNELIRGEAERMYRVKEKSLISAFKSKETALQGVFIGSLAYGLLVTVFTAIRSKAFVSDFKTFFCTIWYLLTSFVKSALKGAIWTSQLGDKIPQPIVATIVHWLLLILVMIVLVGGLGTLLFFGFRWIYKGYTKELEFADEYSLAEFLITLAISVFFADAIRSVLPINLLLLLILIHLLYVLVRWYIKGCKRSRGYYY